MIHITQACVDMLDAAITESDLLLVQAEVQDNNERLDHRQDGRRLTRYRERRAALVAHRGTLCVLYRQITGKSHPSEEVPF